MVETPVEMKEVSEETMERFSEYCYTGGYDVYLRPNTMGCIAEEEALAHARLYVFAKSYSIKALQELVVRNLFDLIAHSSRVKLWVMPGLVEYALENIPEEPIPDRLVGFLARCTASMVDISNKNCKSVRSLLASISRKDFFAVFCESVTCRPGAFLPENPSAAFWKSLLEKGKYVGVAGACIEPTHRPES